MRESEPTGPAEDHTADAGGGSAAEESAAGAAEQQRPKKATRRRTTKATGATKATEPAKATGAAKAASPEGADASTEDAAAPATKATRTRRKKATSPAADQAKAGGTGETGDAGETGGTGDSHAAPPAAPEPVAGPTRAAAAPLFLAPEAVAAAAESAAAAAEPSESGGATRRRRTRKAAEPATAAAGATTDSGLVDSAAATAAATSGEGVEGAEGGAEADESTAEGQRSRRRGRRGRGRGKGAAQDDTTPADADAAEDTEPAEAGEDDGGEEETAESVRRRRRRRRRKGAVEGEPAAEEGVHTVVKVRDPRANEDEVRGVTGSTRLEAKRQRRRGGRDQRRTRPPVLSESEFLARRESVERMMVIREHNGRTQVGVLEDGVLVEHYVTRATGSSIAGSVYLGKVQNVLPSMEAAFVDVGRGRNAVLYAGEVNWDVAGLEGKARSIEQALKSGDSVMVQVTKDPVGNKGARLTSSIALSGRHLVYVPYGNASGISRKLPDTERRRLRNALKDLVPEGAGVIVRTAAEGASEEDLARDIKRLQTQWEEIQAKANDVSAPALLYAEPDLVVRVVRDLFNEDFRELVIEGDSAYETVEAYLSHVSPDLVDRLRRHTSTADVFATYRVEEQILKGLDRKVYLPSGGHLVIDRTEAMTVIDVNTGKYTGTGGNLEETVTRNNLEAAEEIVRQLRLRDIGGIIVIDFIDMVLESNRELVLRRLTECLGRDRTKHQVTEITSLGLVQMTRKRVGAGLLEVFSETCECCKGRGVVVNLDPAPPQPKGRDAAAKVKAVASASSSGQRRGRGRGQSTRQAGKAVDGEGGPAADVEPEVEPVTGAEPAAAAPAGPAPEVQPVDEPAAPVAEGTPETPDARDTALAGPGVSGSGQAVPLKLDVPGGDDQTASDDDGLPVVGMLRRFRRSGNRRTRP
jgi:ribonuclease E